LLKVLRTNVTTQIVRNGWPILGLMAYSAEIEQSAIETSNGQLDAYGIELTRMGNFDINLKPEDEAQLKQLAKDTSYSQLAGGFQRYAAGEMALGAGQGMAQGGAGTEAAFLAAGFGMGNVLGGQAAPPPPGPPGQYGQQPPYGQQPQGPGPQGQGPQGPGPQGGAPAPAPAGVVCAQCQAATRRARSSAWVAARRWPRRSSTAPNAAPNCRRARTSARRAAPVSAAESA